MKSVKAFPYIFFHSLTSITYYKDILRSNRKLSIKYFVVLASLASLVTSLNLAFKVTPNVRSTIDKVLSQMEAMYPNDLVIKTENNTWQINKPEPLVMPFVDAQEMEQQKLPKNFIVFSKQGTIDDLEKFDTFILVNEKNVIVRGSDKIESYPLKDVPNGEFNKQKMTTAINNLRGFLGFLEAGIIVLLSFFVILYNFAFRVVYLFVVAAIVWIIGIVASSNLTYRQSFRIGLHTMTLPIVIELMLLTANIQFRVPLWFMLTNLLFALVVVLGNKNTAK